MRHASKTSIWALTLVTSLLLLAFLTGDAWNGGNESALAAQSQPAIAISHPGDSGAGPQQVGCIGLPWPIPLNDGDCDGFSTNLEIHVGTDPVRDCGAGAWAADLNNDGFSDMFDIAIMAGKFGSNVITDPSSARSDIAPEPVGDGQIDVIGDITKLSSFFTLQCS
jgi:hypothetical protein